MRRAGRGRRLISHLTTTSLRLSALLIIIAAQQSSFLPGRTVWTTTRWAYHCPQCDIITKSHTDQKYIPECNCARKEPIKKPVKVVAHGCDKCKKELIFLGKSEMESQSILVTCYGNKHVASTTGKRPNVTRTQGESTPPKRK